MPPAAAAAAMAMAVAPTWADRLLDAVRAQRFEDVSGAFPSIDLAVAAFLPGQAPLCANVLFSREHPQGLIATFDGPAGAVNNVRFDADQRDADGESVAWLPGADWSTLQWHRLGGASDAGLRVVAPYPASLLKLMVAVGIGMAVDDGPTGWPDALEPMLTVSDNDATTACVALLHRVAMIDRLNARLAQLGLWTLQLHGTRADGGWRNADGAGVGCIQMTAWDTVRLLWLLDTGAPPAPWLAARQAPGIGGSHPLLQPATADHLHALLRRQQLDEVLSSGSLRGLPGWVPGLPDAPTFAHKTGTTDNYASDAGIVRDGRTHYIVAVLTSLGRRHAPDPRCATTWRLPALGAVVHRMIVALKPGSA